MGLYCIGTHVWFNHDILHFKYDIYDIYDLSFFFNFIKSSSGFPLVFLMK